MNIGRYITVPEGGATALVYSDAQCPFQDPRAWGLVLGFAARERPTFIVNLGDDADCYHWSRFEKSMLDRPPGYRGTWNADLEIRAVHAHWDSIKAASPRSIRLYAIGNHEDRVRSFYRGAGRDVERRDTDFAHEFDVRRWWHLFAQDFRVGKLWFTHGHTVVKYAASLMLNEWGRSVCFGHTHRPSFWPQHTKDGDEHAAWGLPCLCRLDSHYTYKPNWSHGFAYVYFDRSGWFNVQPIPIIRNRYVFGPTLYKG